MWLYTNQLNSHIVEFYYGILSAIQNALSNKEAVQIAGFGSFKVAQRSARKGRHPQTGEEIDIPARAVAKFVPGKALKEAVK